MVAAIAAKKIFATISAKCASAWFCLFHCNWKNVLSIFSKLAYLLPFLLETSRYALVAKAFHFETAFTAMKRRFDRWGFYKMKRHFQTKNIFSPLSYGNTILLSVLIFILLIITLTTIFYFANGEFGNFARKNAITHNESTKTKEDFSPSHFYEEGYSLFSGISRLRAVTKDGVSVVVFPWLSYTKDDSLFYEELSQKTQELKDIVSDYFSENTKTELLAAGENAIKQALCDRMNQTLSLNKIKTVFFSEYILLD